MRILLGIILALSASFACDQPYEEVSDYKIGCNFDDADRFHKIGERWDMGTAFYTKKTSGFFDVINIVTIDGKIESISFERNKNRSFNQGDKEALLDSLNKRWGSIESIGGSYFITPKSNVVGMITFIPISTSAGNIFSLEYESKEFIKMKQDQKEKDEKKIRDELKRF